MIEFRIYYECLEQAYHYIRPIVQSAATSPETEVKLVKRVRNEKLFPVCVMRAIHSLTTPDILIAGISENKEIPLVLIEFTEAVTTEDHELQRSYGAVAAFLAKMFYVKVSGQKLSESKFGGAEYDPYSSPRIFADRLGYKGFIIADWATEPDNPNQLQRTPGLPGCPPEIPILRSTIQKAIEAFCKNPEEWFDNALRALQDTDSYIKFNARVDTAPSLAKLLREWRERERRNLNRNKLRYFVNEDWIGVKINRFSHAMDPDRGIITFLSALFSDSQFVFGIYALVRPRSTDLLRENVTDVASMKKKLNAALEKDESDGSSIPDWLKEAIKRHATQAKELDMAIDFQGVWEENQDKIQDNKVVMTLAYFLDGIYLNQNGIRLFWNRYSLLGQKRGGNFIGLLKKHLGFDIIGVPPPLKETLNEVDEDEVTYAIAHRVLLPNGFRIVGISYPGSQGGWAILPERREGKAQSRKYPDIAALPPNAANFDVLVNENKGMFDKQEIEKAVHKLRRYQRGGDYHLALKEALVLARVITPKGKMKNIVIGVGFGAKSQTRWQPKDVDFIFRIADRKRWSIGIFRQELRDLIPKIEGDTSYPPCFQFSELDPFDDLVAASQTSLAFWDNPLDDEDWNDA